MESEKSSKQGIQVIARAASILRALEGQANGLSLGELSKKVDLPRSTVQRIVYSLADEGFLIAASPSARVRLGPGLVSLGSAAKIDIDRVIVPHMKALSLEVEETVDLSMLEGNTMMFIDQVASEAQTLRAVSSVGHAFPIHKCANGKAVLASFDDESVASILDIPERLSEELIVIRKTGIAFDREEHLEGICAVGIALDDPYGRHIALSIPVPAIRFYKSEATLVASLLKYKTIIEKALGT